MHGASGNLRPSRGPLLVALCLLATGCGDTLRGCPGLVDEPLDFPRDAFVPSALGVRISQSGIDYIAGNVAEFLGVLYEANDAGVVEVPLPDSGPFEAPGLHFTLRDSSVFVFTEDVEQRMRFSLSTEPEGIRIQADDLRFGLRAVVGDMGGLLVLDNTACRLINDIDRGQPTERAGTASVDLIVQPRVDSEGNFSIRVLSGAEVVVQELDVDFRSDCGFSECDRFGGCIACETVCVSADLLGEIGGILSPILSDLFTDLFTDILRLLLNATFDELSDEPLTLGGQFILSDLLPIPLPSLKDANPLGFLFEPAAGGFAVDGEGPSRGLNLPIGGGFTSRLHRCVEPAELPPAEIRPLPTLPERDAGGGSFDLGAMLSLDFMNRAAHALYEAGALCVELDTTEVAALTGGELNFNAGSLFFVSRAVKEYASLDAPLRIRLRPSEPPTFRVDDEGPDLLRLRWGGLSLDIEAWVADRFARLLSLNVDASFGVNVEAPESGGLRVITADIELGELSQEYNELMPDADLEELVPLLLRVVEGTVLPRIIALPLELGTLLGGAGLTLRIDELRPDDEGGHFLQLLLSFEDGSEQSFELAPPSLAGVTAKAPQPGMLQVSLPPTTAACDAEYLLHVSGGPYIGPLAPGEHTLREPLLLSPGRHALDVIGRHHCERPGTESAPRRLHVEVTRAALAPPPPQPAPIATEDAGGGCRSTGPAAPGGALFLLWGLLWLRRGARPTGPRRSFEQAVCFRRHERVRFFRRG